MSHSTLRQCEGEFFGLRVLCIDDDPDVVRAIESCLRQHGATVFCAYNGRQGIWLALKEKPDIVITDIVMPLAEGGTVIECLLRNADTQSIPMVVISGRRPDRLKHGLLKSVRAWLPKPMRHDELLAVVRQLAPAVVSGNVTDEGHRDGSHSRFAG